MSDANSYTPPKIWTWDKANGAHFANINRPIARATHEHELPRGKHPLQLYSLATPSGVKVTVMLEELLALGHAGAEYDAWLIRINEGEQFGSGFIEVNPNSKIPALLDCSGPAPVSVFESGLILLYLAEKFGVFVPTEPARRAECLSWLFWQMGSAPFLGCDEYTIADMAIWPWYGVLVKGLLYEAGEFLQVNEFTHVIRWAAEIAKRPAVKRGCIVNRVMGPLGVNPELKIRA